mgnify:FL=1
MIVFEYVLLIFLIVCAIGATVAKKLLVTVIIFMAYSTAMALVWVLLKAPDLAITEAAVGAGVTTILFFITLKKVRAIKETREK